jgi:hypothetical protein
MNDPLLMRSFESLSDLSRHRQRLVHRNRPLCDAIGERRPLDQLQHQRLDTLRLFKAVNRGDIGMVQRRENLSLAFEARKPVGIEREEFGQDLQRDVAIEHRVTRAIDLAHPARTKRRQYLVRAEASAERKSHGRRGL